MDAQLILAMISFAFVTSITPGPNNIMLLASGANFGFRRTIPHMLGIGLGMVLLLSCVIAGLGEVFTRFPFLQLALKVAGALYLTWLAWKIAFAPVGEIGANVQERAQPMRWWQAVAFQFVNPKAWMMAIGAVSSFTLAGEHYIASGLWLMLVFALVNIPSVSVWAGFGVVIRRWLSNPVRQRYFNWGMGFLTVATVFMIVKV